MLADMATGQYNPGIAALLGRAPRFPLAHLPTPLETARSLEASLPATRLFFKRDDCTGLALGGNKTRKLEFSIGHALELGATALVTASGLQSNHIRQTAAAAARAQLSFHAVVAPTLAHFPRAHIESGNLLLDGILGAHFHVAPNEASLEMTAGMVARRLKAAGERPFIIPLGASDGVGSLGYVQCALEILDQCVMLSITPGAIFIATGSCGTQAGLLAGLRLCGSEIPVIGISVSDPAPVKCDRIRFCLGMLEEALGCAIPIPHDEIIVFDGYAGEGYSHQTEAANSWIRHVARSDGVLLDPIYTGKAFAGMADLLQSGMFAGEDIIFLHSGGAPALFADPGQLWRPERDAPEIAALYERAGMFGDELRSTKTGKGKTT